MNSSYTKLDDSYSSRVSMYFSQINELGLKTSFAPLNIASLVD